MQSDHFAPKGDPPLRAAIPKRPRGGCEPASPRVRAAPDRSSESGDNAGDLPRRTSKRLPAPAKAPQRDPLRPRNRALFAAKNNRQRRRPYRPANRLAFPQGFSEEFITESSVSQAHFERFAVELREAKAGRPAPYVTHGLHSVSR